MNLNVLWRASEEGEKRDSRGTMWPAPLTVANEKLLAYSTTSVGWCTRVRGERRGEHAPRAAIAGGGALVRITPTTHSPQPGHRRSTLAKVPSPCSSLSESTSPAG